MKELRNIIDTWNMIERYGIESWTTTDHDTVEISDTDYQRILDGSTNKNYIKNLLAGNGSFCTHGYTR